MDDLDAIIMQIQLATQELKDDNDKFERQQRAIQNLRQSENVNEIHRTTQD
jgi:hypothetical protein